MRPQNVEANWPVRIWGDDNGEDDWDALDGGDGGVDICITAASVEVRDWRECYDYLQRVHAAQRSGLYGGYDDDPEPDFGRD